MPLGFWLYASEQHRNFSFNIATTFPVSRNCYTLLSVCFQSIYPFVYQSVLYVYHACLLSALPLRDNKS